MTSTLQNPANAGEPDGGRDRDRTCDPYDVNTVDDAETRSSSVVSDQSNAVCSRPDHGKLGHRLGEDPNGIGEAARFRSAVDWLSKNLDGCPRPIIQYVKLSYGLGNVRAVEAVTAARSICSNLPRLADEGEP